MKLSVILLAIVPLFISACTGSKRFKKSSLSKIKNGITNNQNFQQHFTGFHLVDAITNQTVIDINGNQNFTPASNIKILTLLTALETFPDSFPLLKFEMIGQDSLAFQGTGYPLNLHNGMQNDSTHISFLQSQNAKLFYCDRSFQSEKYGAGWAWDDAPYNYQRTLSPLPLYGQLVEVIQRKDSISITPILLDTLFQFSNTIEASIKWENNHFMLPVKSNNYKKTFPFNYNYKLTKNLLSNLINKEIHSCPTKIPIIFSHTLKTKNDDSLYIELMQQSDNFIAEQLLLMCSNAIFDTMSTAKVIKYSKENILNLENSNIRWVDGSGLSRYNLISPQILTKLLHQLYIKIGFDRIKKLFPAGGESGTIRDWYKGENEPYIYAKTGSLSNNHCLSGYLITKKKKLLIFSFMHNHYLSSSKPVKLEMQGILEMIYEEN